MLGQTFPNSARSFLSREGFLRLLYHLGTGRAHTEQDSYAVLVVDVDNVSRLNALLRDETGGQLLDLVVGRIHQLVPAESLLTRIRPTSLGILAFETADTNAAESLCAALHEAIRKPMTVCGREVHLSASIGVSFASSNVSPLTAMQHAELAVDRVRTNGGDATFFHRSEPGTDDVEVAA